MHWKDSRDGMKNLPWAVLWHLIRFITFIHWEILYPIASGLLIIFTGEAISKLSRILSIQVKQDQVIYVFSWVTRVGVKDNWKES